MRQREPRAAVAKAASPTLNVQLCHRTALIFDSLPLEKCPFIPTELYSSNYQHKGLPSTRVAPQIRDKSPSHPAPVATRRQSPPGPATSATAQPRPVFGFCAIPQVIDAAFQQSRDGGGHGCRTNRAKAVVFAVKKSSFATILVGSGGNSLAEVC